MKKTKIVSTLGPASGTVEIVSNLIEAGTNVFRFNFSHGDHAEHLERINMVHEAEKKTGKTVGLLLDTKGAEIRTTVQSGETGKLQFSQGDKVIISMDDTLEGTNEKIAVTYPGLFDDVEVGGTVLFDDGDIGMTILAKDEANRELSMEVQNDGILGSRKGVNAPGVSINLPGITERDADDIKFGLDNGINFIAASFVRKPEDVNDIRKILVENGKEDVLIMPKIESQEGIDNFDAILEVSDGLMVARGDMGVEIPPENVPQVQKELIRKMNAAGKPVITATDMLDSMQENPRPTRAEISDIENAVLDRTDTTMLSGESANGSYPVEAVQMMANANEKAESLLKDFGRRMDGLFDENSATESLAAAVKKLADSDEVAAIVTSTASGATARLISKHRPEKPIVAITYDERVQRSLTMNYAVYPFMETAPNTVDDMIDLAKKVAVDKGFAKKGDKIVISAGIPMNQTGTTNLLTIQTI